MRQAGVLLIRFIPAKWKVQPRTGIRALRVPWRPIVSPFALIRGIRFAEKCIPLRSMPPLRTGKNGYCPCRLKSMPGRSWYLRSVKTCKLFSAGATVQRNKYASGSTYLIILCWPSVSCNIANNHLLTDAWWNITCRPRANGEVLSCPLLFYYVNI